MNGSSHPTGEHHIVSEYLQGLLTSRHRYGTAGLVRFLGKQEIEAAAGAPPRGGGTHRNGGMGVSTPINNSWRPI